MFCSHGELSSQALLFDFILRVMEGQRQAVYTRL